FHTGGLKDTVVEFVPAAGTGNGFSFMNYTSGDLLYAMERAIRVFDDKEKYTLLRQLARQSVVSCECSSWAWLCEFARLRNKIPINENKVQQIYESLPEWSEGAWRRRKDQLAAAATGIPCPAASSWGSLQEKEQQQQQQQQQQQLQLLQQQAEAAAEFWALPASAASKGRSKKKLRIYTSSSSSSSSTSTSSSGDEPTTARSRTSSSSSSSSSSAEKAASHASRTKKLLPSVIRYIPPQAKPRPRSVAVAGSFDDWRVRRPLTWDNAVQAFSISLALPPGEYTYKLVVDGEWVCCHGSPTARDAGGNENNILRVE
ncbi:Alpha amylase domain-containing protein, related, partial [Eimeria acervulina]